MKKQSLFGLFAAFMLTFQLSATADDIELFSGAGSAADSPDVLLVLDNAANFSASVATQRCSITAGGDVETDPAAAGFTAPTLLDGTAGAVEQCALYSALKALDASATARINIGVMGFNANDMKTYDPVTDTFLSGCVNGTGGCLLMPLTPLNDITKPRILEWIRNWAISGGSNYVIKGNNTANGAVMQEAWAYFYSHTGVSGRVYSNDTLAASCANKYIIFVGNAYRNNATPGDGTNEANSPRKPFDLTSLVAGKRADPAPNAEQKADITGNITTSCGASSLSTAELRGAYALKWARYMYKTKEVTTYSIGVLGPTCNSEYAAHLTKLGDEKLAGGKFFGTNNYHDLEVAFETVLSEIMAKNSAFASVSLPVSVNTQGTYLNQVYIGMFRPAANFRPRWPGNLKQYRLGIVGSGDTAALKLLDAKDPGEPAISASGGFIAECARSYWTPAADDTYWGTTFSEANCTPHPASSNSPDGNIVEKGAQGYKLRDLSLTPAARAVKTCGDASCTILDDFDENATLVSKTALGDASMTDAARIDLINWARGLNNKGDETNVSTDVTADKRRPSIHGDIVHSRPVAIDYAAVATPPNPPEVVVYYGANDGMLRAINGNRDVNVDGTAGLSIGSIPPGGELWSFVAPGFYDKFKRLRDNTQIITYSSADPHPKDYGFDGPVVAHKSASNTWIYASMRRGGRELYAFDVTTPISPELKWKIGCPNADDDTGCTVSPRPSTPDTVSEIQGIGQTWSAPTVIFASGYNSGDSPMLILGGGYDPCEDVEIGTANHNCTSSTNGNKIYVLDADTGEILNTPDALNTDRSVIASITIVKNSLGEAQYGYTADTGGNIYRINMLSAAPADWSITKIATLGCGPMATDTCPANRKFMFAPDVLTDGTVNYILIGSGDREKPVVKYTVTSSVVNYFFMIKDQPSNGTWLTSENTNCGANILCLESLAEIPHDGVPPDDIFTKKGWYLGMAPTEQTVTSAITVSNIVTFSTHQPTIYNALTCSSDLGIANVYNINFRNAESVFGPDGSRYQDIEGGGLPPSPVAGEVTLDDGTTVPFLIGGDPDSPLEGGAPPGTISWGQPKSRVYWYIEQ